MKSSFYIIILTVAISSCSKKELDCISVDYNKYFQIELNQEYCFPDGNKIKKLSFLNEFCPYGAFCKWEGEMILKGDAILDNLSFKIKVGSSEHTDSLFLRTPYLFRIRDIVFEKTPSWQNQVPKILSAKMIILN